MFVRIRSVFYDWIFRLIGVPSLVCRMAPIDVVRRGISLKQLQLFVTMHREWILEKTTAEMISLIKLVTGLHSTHSYIDIVSQTRPDEVGPATNFVIHTGKGQYIDLVRALEYEFPAGNQYFWIDIFCSKLRPDFAIQDTSVSHLLDTMDRLLPSLPNATLVLSEPIDQHALLTRSWCLYELLLAMEHGLCIRAALPAAALHAEAAAGVAVDIAAAEASQPADAAAILDRIALRAGGAEAFDRSARDCLAACLAAAATSTGTRQQASSEGKTHADSGVAAHAMEPLVQEPPPPPAPPAPPAGSCGDSKSSRRSGAVSLSRPLWCRAREPPLPRPAAASPDRATTRTRGGCQWTQGQACAPANLDQPLWSARGTGSGWAQNRWCESGRPAVRERGWACSQGLHNASSHRGLARRGGCRRGGRGGAGRGQLPTAPRRSSRPSHAPHAPRHRRRRGRRVQPQLEGLRVRSRPELPACSIPTSRAQGHPKIGGLQARLGPTTHAKGR
jgi:hypothetical protein